MTNEEQTLYDGLNQSAAALAENVCSYLGKLLPEQSRPEDVILDAPKLSVVPALKRIGKQYGYSYVKHEYGCFYVQKRTTNGHYILLDIDVGPTFKGVGVLIRHIGAGFEHQIGSAFRYPRGQQGLEDFLSQIFSALASAEKDVLPALDAHYPPTPDWYMPIV